MKNKKKLLEEHATWNNMVLGLIFLKIDESSFIAGKVWQGKKKTAAIK